MDILVILAFLYGTYILDAEQTLVAIALYVGISRLLIPLCVYGGVLCYYAKRQKSLKFCEIPNTKTTKE